MTFSWKKVGYLSLIKAGLVRPELIPSEMKAISLRCPMFRRPTFDTEHFSVDKVGHCHATKRCRLKHYLSKNSLLLQDHR